MNDPLVSFNTPFQSGDGLCYPVYPKNYYKTETSPMYGGRKKSQKTQKSQKSQKTQKTQKTQKSKKFQKGGNTIGDYSQPSTVNDYPGNAYLSSPDERYALTGSGVPQAMNPLTEKFLSNNMGITYATQAGGKRKNKKGGIGAGSFDGQIGALQGKQNENSGTLNRAQSQRGGYNVVAEEEMVKSSILSNSTPTQGMYSVLSGGKYRKYNKRGGNMPPNAAATGATTMTPEMVAAMAAMAAGTTGATGMTPGMTPGAMATGATGMTSGATGATTMTPEMAAAMATGANIMSGGRRKKYNKKGGNYIFRPGANFSSQPAEIATQMDQIAQAQHTPKGGFAMKDMSGVDAQMAASSTFLDIMSGGRKKSSRKLKGGSDDMPALDSQIEDIMSGGRKKSSRKLKGGVSDFATTLSSRGPINYPDTLSAQRFRYFTKTGSFIPNSQLQYAAAPISTGYEADPNPYPMAYNDYIGGSKKKATSSKKKQVPSKKKATSTKKKSFLDKKKK